MNNNGNWQDVEAKLREFKGIREREYRRGYADGWAECTNAIIDSSFILKYTNKLFDLLFRHYIRDLAIWRSASPHSILPPPRFSGLICTYCGDRADSIDHIVPRSREGRNNIDNLTPCCRSCNSRKGTSLLSEWDGWKDGDVNHETYDWKKAYAEYRLKRSTLEEVGNG